ncbi:hypothetical protein SAMN05444487_104148 [Marininema mesophilum]|uniref:Uncharacterized protein n=1 Tax=Marininema mesophilum TaxID=1048340 RepID=A0A1H2ULW1_9BACL|nr:hypothetical protein [Marininema mesophilum]SDW57081.1 hypothetical protein SAMN05444487_104148 [Marininema mesophilum]
MIRLAIDLELAEVLMKYVDNHRILNLKLIFVDNSSEREIKSDHISRIKVPSDRIVEGIYELMLYYPIIIIEVEDIIESEVKHKKHLLEE